jgi:hypothetical protein
MVKVYFESSKDGVTSDNKWAELMAIFNNEETYMICSSALESHAKENKMIVTESIEEQSINDIK